VTDADLRHENLAITRSAVVVPKQRVCPAMAPAREPRTGGRMRAHPARVTPVTRRGRGNLPPAPV